MNIVNLPHDVLICIFEYLSGVDKLNLRATCQIFKKLLEGKTLTRKLSFAGCYNANILHIKSYLKQKKHRGYVKELDLTSCYWLKSVDIQQCVLKLPNLHSLHVADTSLTWTDLVKILNAPCQLKRLSISWKTIYSQKTTVMSDIESVSPQLGRLEFLSVHMKNAVFSYVDLNAFCTWLLHCTALKELWVIVPEQLPEFGVCRPSEARLFEKQLNFPHLHTLVMSYFCYDRFNATICRLFRIIFRGCKSDTVWHCFWVSLYNFGWISHSSIDISQATTVALPPFMTNTSRDCPKLQHLTWCKEGIHHLESALGYWNLTVKKIVLKSAHLKMKWDVLWYLLAGLEELNLMTCVTDIQQVHSQKNLRKLALPICIVRGKEGSGARQRSEVEDVIRVVVETCPNIEEFEFTPCFQCLFPEETDAIISEELESSFMLFGKWKSLRRLKLEGLKSIRSGKFFMQIFKSCENLESISLKDLGLMANCNYFFELCRALKCCKNLRDFRIVQSNIPSTDVLFEALQMCPLIERVCVISIKNSHISNESSLINFICGAPKLVFLYLWLHTLTREACKRIRSHISTKCENNPALHVALQSLTSVVNDVADLPAIHYQMRMDKSRVATRPGNGNWYLSCY